MASAGADRDLLFGLLALQNGLMKEGQLVTAFQAWTLDKSRTLADHLEAQGDLTGSIRPLLEELTKVHVEAHGGDVGKSLVAVSASKTTRESLKNLGDPDLQATLDHVSTGRGTTQAGNAEPSAPYAVGTATSDGQRFEILRLHSRGGLGAVFVALDRELHREVALKQILNRHADDLASRQRFLLEAQVTGGLEHPGIVPVYGLGINAQGRPYYAMRLVRGDTLKEAIERFHGDDSLQRESGRRSLELRKLLRRFNEVCNAIDYAHSRGVLHRDIKPSNIIVGKHGETLVVDWGLAKATGRAESGAEDQTLVPSSSSGSAETLPGDALGTPGYMSPEQAGGDLERLGPATDVYSLGATLYCLLTGKPPFEGAAIDVIARVKQGAFPPPRAQAPSIDRALEAVCLTAMAMDPANRYSTPKALGEDVERWMADEPVAAYREPWTRTLTRWLTRHRTGVTAVGAAMLVAIAGLGAVLGVQAWANNQLTAKNAQLDAAFHREAVVRKEAEANFNMALKAVDDYLTSVSENTLFKLQDSVDIRRLRQELLNSALTYYKTFVKQRSDDPLLRQQLARAHFRVAQISQEVESPKQAIEAYRQALAIWEPLVAAHPRDQELQRDVGASYLAVGRLYDMATNVDSDQATTSLSRARAIFESLVAANPAEPSYQSSLAESLSEIAAVKARQDQPGESMVLLEKAKALEQDLIKRYPDKHAYQRSLAEITNVLGYAYYKRRRHDDALNSFREVQNICQSVSKQVTVGPKPLWLLNLLALSHSNIAWICQEKGQAEAALRSFELAVDYRSALVEAHPSVTEYKAKLGVSRREIAQFQHESHQDDKAFPSIAQSIEVLTALVRAQPDHAGYHSELGLSWNYLGVLNDHSRKQTEALAAFEHAVLEQQLAVKKANVDHYQAYLANHLANLGEALVDLGQVGDGLRQHGRSLAIFRDLRARHPDTRYYSLEVLRGIIRQGKVERHSGDSAAALQSFAAARTILDRLPTAESEDPALRVLRGAVLDLEANALFDQGRAAEAQDRLQRALALLQLRTSSAPSGQANALESQSRHDVLFVLGQERAAALPGYHERRFRSEALADLACIFRGRRLFAEAEKADAERAAVWEGKPLSELVDTALEQLESALLIGLGKTPLSDRAKAVRELDLAKAADTVRLAIALGLTDLSKVRSHPDARFLLSRKELEPLLMDMAFPDRPFAAQ
jgi:serine/threonine-protein kinase